MHLVLGGRGGGSLLLLLHPGEHLLIPAVPVHGVRHLHHSCGHPLHNYHCSYMLQVDPNCTLLKGEL